MNFALLFLIVNLIFFAAVAYYFTVVRKEMKEEHTSEVEEEKMHEEEIARDENKLKEELADAHKRATTILAQSEKIVHELISELEGTLGKKSADTPVTIPEGSNFEIELGALWEKIKVQYVDRIHQLLESVENFKVDQAQKVQAYAEEQEEATDRSLQQMRVQQLEEVHKRIERYKEEELSLFNKRVKEVIDAAASEVLGQALSTQELEALITKSLEKAKKDGVI